MPNTPVDVPVPTATSAAVTSLCRGLVATLPERLSPGVTRRPVKELQRAAAWGEPALTLACGVAAPSGLVEPLVLDGLALATFRRAGRVLWFTTDRAVTVRLDIPLSYESQADVVIPLIPALKRLPTR